MGGREGGGGREGRGGERERERACARYETSGPVAFGVASILSPSPVSSLLNGNSCPTATETKEGP